MIEARRTWMLKRVQHDDEWVVSQFEFSIPVWVSENDHYEAANCAQNAQTKFGDAGQT